MGRAFLLRGTALSGLSVVASWMLEWTGRFLLSPPMRVWRGGVRDVPLLEWRVDVPLGGELSVVDEVLWTNMALTSAGRFYLFAVEQHLMTTAQVMEAVRRAVGFAFSVREVLP